MSDSTPGVQQILASDSALPEIPFGGRLWKVGRPDQDAKGRLENLVKKVAIDEVRALRGVLDAAAYQEAFREITTNLKQFATWRPSWQATVFDPANSHLFLWSLLQAHHPNCTEADVKTLAAGAPEEVQFALAQVMPDFFRLLLVGVEMNPHQRAKTEEAIETFRGQMTPTPASTLT